MTERPQAVDVKSGTEPTAVPPATPTPAAPRRSPGHRGTDIRDTVAEMAARAQEISQEAGSKMAAAMKDVINAAAGIAGFSLESARDLVQYMVRRGQMTQEEADKLIREAEDAQPTRKNALPPPPSRSAAKAAPAAAAKAAPPVVAKAAAPAPAPAAAPVAVAPVKVAEPAHAVKKPVVPEKAVMKAPAPAPKAAAKPAAKAPAKASAKPAAKAPAKPAAKATSKPSAKPAKAASKPASKSAAKKPAKKR